MEQILDQSERTEPAADHPPKQHAVQKQNAAYIEKGAAVGAEGSLEGPQGAGTHGPGAGIAVQTRDAELLAAAPVNASLGKALEIGIEQQSKVQLHQLPSGGQYFS